MSENHLLAALPGEAREHLSPHLERIPLTLGDVIYEPEEQIQDVYFPTSGVISLLCTTEEGLSIEAGTVGREGMAGLTIFLGVDLSPNRAIVQVEGEGLRMRADIFREVARQNNRFHDILHLYTYALITQMSLSIGCNRFHSVEKRLARWLLMMQDRAQTDEFRFTQELISRMIGTHRPHVSTAVCNLHSAGLIRNGRGRIDILDRPGLEKVSCYCYHAAKRKFDGLLSQ